MIGHPDEESPDMDSGLANSPLGVATGAVDR